MKLHAPAALRNRDVIAEVLDTIMPPAGRILEVAAGSGQHAVTFASRFPHVEYVPSDLDAQARASIDAFAAEAGLTNLRAALELDATASSWPLTGLAGVININMIHISPWEACAGLLERAAEALAEGGFLFLYGPFIRADVATAPSNLAFDRSLRARDPRWGLRALDDIEAVASAGGLERTQLVEMPANNLSVVFRRAPRETRG